MKKIRHVYIYGILRFFFILFDVIPRNAALFLGKLLGIAVYRFSRTARDVAFENVQYLHPTVENNSTRRMLVIRNFTNIGRNLADALRLMKYRNGSLNRIVRIKNGNNIRELLNRKKGLIVVTAHLGCWELIPAYFSQIGYNVNVIAQEVYDRNVNRVINRIRESFSVRVIDKDRSPIVALKRLLRGEAVGILIDQNTRKNSVPVEFLGREANAPIGPAYLAMKTGAPVVPVAIHRLQDDIHLLEVGKEIEILNTGDEQKNICINTRRCSKAIERYIVKYPDEWVWSLRRWG